MKVNVLSRKLVKPFNPTPSHLRTYKISLLDEINPATNHPRLLFFSSDDRMEAEWIYLEESLAQILSKFYPLVGRYDKEKREVCCNDEGAQYSVAEVDCDLSQIVGATAVEPEHLNQLLPVDIAAVDDPADPILAVRINRFRCGGLAIGVCMSHRVGDTAAFALFLTAWAEAAASGGKHFIEPHFDHRPYFPTENLPPLDCHDSRTKPEKIACRRYVFDGEAIQKLREQLITEWKSIGAERPPSRVVAVSTFLTQAVLR